MHLEVLGVVLRQGRRGVHHEVRVGLGQELRTLRWQDAQQLQQVWEGSNPRHGEGGREGGGGAGQGYWVKNKVVRFWLSTSTNDGNRAYE